MNTREKFVIRVRWGATGEKVGRYILRSEKEVDAFLRGVRAADGWTDSEVISVRRRK